MSGAIRSCVRLGMAIAFLVELSAKADFDTPYSVTPPDPGTYGTLPFFNWTNSFGNWTAVGRGMTVNTMEAPLTLRLSVPAHTAVGAYLDFGALAPDTGIVSFDCTAVSLAPGFIKWFQQSAASQPSFVMLDALPSGQPVHFDLPVQAGDTFGFSLLSAGDVVYPGDPAEHSLMIMNFSGPVPEPSTCMLLAASFALFAARFRCRGNKVRRLV